MSPGTPAPATRRAVPWRRPRRCGAGGFSFAEDPGIGAPDARILWHEALDPGALAVTVTPVVHPDPDAVDLACLAPWLTIVDGCDAREHAVLSDGWRRIRFDVHAGTLRDGGAVVFHYHLHGTRSAEPKLLPLRRLVTLCRAGRFAATLYPPDRRLPRWIEFLRASDARASGASYRDIAIAMFGEERTRREWHDPGRSLHSHVRRLVAGAAAMAAGGYRDLLRSPGQARSSRPAVVEADRSGSVRQAILHVRRPRLGWTTMRTDLDHLPDRKRRDLDRIVEVLFAEFEQATSLSTQKWRRQGRILKVILYGSYARGDWVDDPIGGYQSDYDILVVVSDERLTDPAEFWAKADDQFVREVTIARRITAPVTFIVHSLAEVNDQLTHGRPFFIDVVEQGIALYEVEDYPFVTPRPLEPAAALAEARKHFDQWFPKAQNALRTSHLQRAEGDTQDWRSEAAFSLHQATERFYHCLLLTLTLYSPKSHKLNFLRSQAEPLVPDLIAVWPRDTRFAQRCFELLRQAYVNARYSPHYRTSAAELEWLAERVTLLQQIVRDACEARLASG